MFPQTAKLVWRGCLFTCLAWALVAGAQNAYDLPAGSDTTAAGSAASLVLGTWLDVTDGGGAFEASVTIPDGPTDVLVMASFSSHPTTAVNDTGEWRLTDGTTFSTEIHRSLVASATDYGIATVTWLFEGLGTGAHTFNLQHRTALGNGMHTEAATIVALPMVVSATPPRTNPALTNLDLNADADDMGAYEFTTTNAGGETVEKALGVDLEALVTLDRPGSMFVAASLNARPGASAALHTGEWDLQVDGMTITSTQRTMQAAGGNDRGAITLYGLAEGVTAATHSVTLISKSASTDPVINFNAVIAGMALTFDDDAVASTYFQLPAWEATGTGSQTATDPPGTAADIATESALDYAAGASVFLAASYNATTTGANVAQNGSFRIHASSGPTGYSSEAELRALSGSNDIGSGGNVGLAAGLAAGTYAFSLEATNEKTQANPIPDMDTNATLVGFGMGAAAAHDGTPARDLTSSLAAPESGGVLVNWQTGLESGVCSYHIMRREQGVWAKVGHVFAKAEPFRGAAYGYLDRAAVPDLLYDYRLDVVDNDGTTRNWAVGRIAAVATAKAVAQTSTETRATLVPKTAFAAPTRSTTTLTELAEQVASHATSTPTQTGTARQANIARTGLYQAPGTDSLYSVGQELPRLAGGLVFVRGLSDFYTDTNVLWAGNLSIDGRPGVIPDPPVTAIHGAQGLEGVYHVEEDSSFTVNDHLPPGPNWYFSRSFELKGGSICTVPVQIPAPRSGTARITVNVRATSTTSHDLGITINGTAIGQAIWHETGHYRIEASFASDLLDPGENVVQLQTDTAGSTKRLDYVEIQTPIDPALRDGDLLVRVAAGASGSLNVPGATHAVDATTFGGETALAITDGTVAGLSAGQLVFLTDTTRQPNWGSEQTLSLSGLRDANYVAVAPADMLAELGPLLTKRRGEGRRTASLTLQQAQDLFGGGLFGPAAIARLAQDISPTCLLLGAGTTYDYKHNDPTGNTPLGIPCGFVHVREGMAASDDLYTDGYTVAVGRLPARTAAELRTVVTKIVAFQPGRRVALLADADDTDNGLDRFAALQRELAGIMPSDLIESSGRSGSAVRADLIDAIRGGDKLVAYQGHGGTEYLGYNGNRIFGVEHCTQVPPSAWLLSTCLTGSYIVNNTSVPILSHKLLTTPVNGAVSALCSTRHGAASVEHEIVRLSLTRMAQGGATWGDILLLLKRELGETETGQIYTLLGDPALRAVDLADPRELAVLAPNAGDLVGGGGKVTVRFRLLGEGWAGETMEVCYRRAAGNWVRITTVETNADTTDYETEWTPPDDGRDYQVMVREVQP
ncbi:MAG: hypothetical protein HN380_03880 [Victivallales bacterium]|nr:hypothetical protein [Victivallales bacterium]